MKDEINWNGLRSILYVFSTALSGFSVTEDEEREYNLKSKRFVIDQRMEANPLLRLPFDVRESITTDYYEPGMSCKMTQYVNDYLIDKADFLQKLFNDLFHYGTRIQSHNIAFNIILSLSELPYEKLGTWADMLAISATRSEYLDVAEMGIRCFENWESINSCEFLMKCHFEEKWLQEYADQVCDYVKGIKEGKDVLFTEDYTWKMAKRGYDNASNIGGYTSRYSTG